MKKQVAVITRAKEIRNSMKDQIDMIFGDLVETSIHSLEDNTVDNLKKSDLYVISSSANEYLDEKFLKNKNIVIVDYTITKERKNFLKNFPKGTKAIFFNVTQKMCMEAIAMMYHLGVNNIEFIPAYPDMEKFPENSLIITPAETKLLPEEAQGREIIDIGHRILDANTIIEIALKLEFEHILYYKKIKEYLDSVATNDYSLSKILEKATQSESQLGILMGILDIAIIGVDKDNFICSCNESAEKILNKKSINLIGNSACDILSCVPFSEVRETGKEIRSRLVQVNGEYVNLNITPVIKAENYMGAFAVLQRFKEEEQKQHELRRQLLNKGHKAKYTFDDILGESGAIKRIKEIAKKMAKTNSAVLITGESGTGKELFAHAIHNYSDRKDYPFVAVNCAAIPENLLESELFGYEEGAFTGANKKGKKGLFELADNGTIFLDEISEIPYHLQSKFLRVLEEKSFRRVGGEENISVNMRIIAASNKNLKDLAAEEKFRKDLYYRLNVLEVRTVPLRERKKDILLIGEFFLKRELLNYPEYSIDDFKDILIKISEFDFSGNVRELKNLLKRIVILKAMLKLSNDKILAQLKVKENVEINTEFSNMTLYEIEKNIILKTLEEENGNKAKTSIRLGIDRGKIDRILKK